MKLFQVHASDEFISDGGAAVRHRLMTSTAFRTGLDPRLGRQSRAPRAFPLQLQNEPASRVYLELLLERSGVPVAVASAPSVATIRRPRGVARDTRRLSLIDDPVQFVDPSIAAEGRADLLLAPAGRTPRSGGPREFPMTATTSLLGPRLDPSPTPPRRPHGSQESYVYATTLLGQVVANAAHPKHRLGQPLPVVSRGLRLVPVPKVIASSCRRSFPHETFLGLVRFICARRPALDPPQPGVSIQSGRPARM